MGKLKLPMNCENPVLALRFRTLNENGKSIIKILPRRSDMDINAYEYRYGKECLIKLPCGKCTACKESYRADWSVRCDMEARYHKENVFLTLTYRDEVCPRWVSKGHLRKFIRALRKEGIDLKYFACGEYGEKTNRPHYHLILFGWFPPDAKLVPEAKTKSGFQVYQSSFLDRIWKKGFVQVTDFSQDTAFYVAGYVNKKTGKYDGFINMSNGIGYQYMFDHINKLFRERVYIARSGRVHFVPRAFKRVLDKAGYFSDEDPVIIDNMRKLEIGDMVSRGLRWREELFGITHQKMKDKTERRLKRL